jgi:hypothetical protein
MLTTLADASPAATPSHESHSLVGAEAADLFRRFPARPRPTAWPETSLSRDALADRLRHLELALPGPGVICPPRTVDLFRRYVDFFVGAGFLPAAKGGERHEAA